MTSPTWPDAASELQDRGRASDRRETDAIHRERFAEFDPEPPVYVGTFVEVLRERARWASRWDGQLMKAAANEIERLEARVAELEQR